VNGIAQQGGGIVEGIVGPAAETTVQRKALGLYLSLSILSYSRPYQSINQYQSIYDTKTNYKQATTLNSPRMKKSYKLQCRTALEPTLAQA